MGSTAKPTAPKAAGKPSLADRSLISWFEIPVFDLARAKAFYDHLYGIRMESSYAGEYAMAFFPASKGIGGALVQGPGCMPNDSGTLIYLNAGTDLDGMLLRVEEAGGRVIMGRSLIGNDAGWFALIIDSEGNRLALHAPPEVAAAKAEPQARASKTSAAKPKAAARKTTKAPAKKSATRKKSGDS
ncbi:MAG: VOC family protein [Flavobacteriales bacterium]|nr:VOC family protein [Flavobacteriales bacterium]